MAEIKLTPERKAAFCAALAESGIVARACKAVNISRQTAYQWREQQEDFAKEWDRALKIGITALEDEAHRRAFEGTDEPVFYQGVASGSVRKYSDTLAIFLLKAHKPEKYRERMDIQQKTEHSGSIELTDTDRAARIAALVSEAAKRKKEQAQGDPPEDGSDLV